MSSEFRDIEQKAESFAKEHPEATDKGVEDAAKFAEQKTGDKYDPQIQRAADEAEQRLTGGSGQGEGRGQGGEGQAS
jgi:MT0933-like antitoxin protein